VAGSKLPVSNKSLGITIDSHLLFDSHANDVVKACNFHARALRLLTNEMAQIVVCSIIASQLHYCHSLLY